MRNIDQLRGLSPHAIATVAGVRLSVAQAGTLKAIFGEPLTREELRAVRTLTGALIAKPKAKGYRTTVVRAGRRGGKTTHIGAPFVVAALLSRCETLLAPGERARVPIIGPTLGHTAQALDAVAGLLAALGVPFTRRAGEIDLAPAGLRTICIATVADHVAPRGGTAVGAYIDEAALLPIDEEADGYDVEVVASLRPALATTGGRLLITSSPWGQTGEHYRLCEEFKGKLGGEVLVADGPTWVWHPALSEAATRELEADPRRWAREYAAQPGEHESSFLSASDVRACVDRDVSERSPSTECAYVAGLDVAFRRDRTALVIVHREQRARAGMPPLDLVIVDCVRVWTPTPGERLDFDQVMKEIANVTKRYGNARVYRDSYSGDAVHSALSMRGVFGDELSFSPREQAARFEFLAQKIRSRTLRLLDHDPTVKELIDLRVRLHAMGRLEIAAPNRKGAHDDLADALSLAVHAVRSRPASGDIRCEVTVDRHEGGIDVSASWRQRVVSPKGRVTWLPTEPPAGTYAAEQARLDRLAQGFCVPSDPEWTEGMEHSINPPIRDND